VGGECLHITQSTYCRIEQKEAHLTMALLKRIAVVLQVPAMALLPDDLVVHNRQIIINKCTCQFITTFKIKITHVDHYVNSHRRLPNLKTSQEM
jgi:transcriptional regulator with XRE-family HTH domain